MRRALRYADAALAVVGAVLVTPAVAQDSKGCEKKIIGTWAVNDPTGRPFEMVVTPDGTMTIRWIITETITWSCSGNTYRIGMGGAGGSEMTLSSDSNLLTGQAAGLGRLFTAPISASRKGAPPASQTASAPSGKPSATGRGAESQPASAPSGTAATTGRAGPQASPKDSDDCRQTDDEDRRIAACARIIKDPKLRDSDRAAAYYNRAAVWNGKGDIDRAIADYTEAIRLDPKDPASYYNRAVAWRAKGEFDRAIADYDHAINPDRPGKRQRQQP